MDFHEINFVHFIICTVLLTPNPSPVERGAFAQSKVLSLGEDLGEEKAKEMLQEDRFSDFSK